MTKSYVAAWPDERTQQLLRELGVEKEIHLTTFFDKGGELEGMTPAPWEGPQFAKVTKVGLWRAGRSYHLMAEVEAPWAAQIHAHYAAQSRLKHPHLLAPRDAEARRQLERAGELRAPERTDAGVRPAWR